MLQRVVVFRFSWPVIRKDGVRKINCVIGDSEGQKHMLASEPRFGISGTGARSDFVVLEYKGVYNIFTGKRLNTNLGKRRRINKSFK